MRILVVILAVLGLAACAHAGSLTLTTTAEQQTVLDAAAVTMGAANATEAAQRLLDDALEAQRVSQEQVKAAAVLEKYRQATPAGKATVEQAATAAEKREKDK